MAQAVKGLESLVAKLRAMAAKSLADDNVSVEVGYGTNYAVYVHENRNAKHRVGRAGYLMDVMRETASAIADVIRKAKKAGRTTAEALLLGGLKLQRESQKNVPVKYGVLKNSAFTRIVKLG